MIHISVAVVEEYYDSSDGTSDVDEKIDELRDELEELTAERDRLKHLLEAENGQTH